MVLAARDSIPLINIELLFGGGSVADRGRPAGTASFTYAMLDEGAAGKDPIEIATAADELGAQVYSGAGLDNGYVGVSALAENIEASLALMVTLIRTPDFPARELERLRKQWLSGIAQEKSQPAGLASRILPPLLYGDGHPYGMPFSGTGTERSITALKRDDLIGYHRELMRPDNVRILVAGDIRMSALLPMLEKRFGNWQAPPTPTPDFGVPAVELPTSPRVFLINRAQAPQTLIFAALLGPSSLAPNVTAIGTMNSVLGGGFTSRINMNLREDKHWSYGASVSMPGARGQRPWLIVAPVQTDKTAESIGEIRKELTEYLGTRPASEDELAKLKERDVRSLPGAYETIGAVQSALRGILINDRPDDWVANSKQRIEAQTLRDLTSAAKEVIKPESLTWVIVGDLSQIEAKVRAMNIGPITVLDEDGKPVQ